MSGALDVLLISYYLYRLCYYTTESLVYKQNFLKEIKLTFGAGGFVCSLTDKELSEFQHFLESTFPFTEAKRVKQGVAFAGKVVDDNVWVLNQHLQIDEDGKQIPEEETKYAWQPIGGPSIEVAGKGNTMTVIDLQSPILLPLQSSDPLQRLLRRMQPVFKHNFIPGVLLRS